MRLSQGETSLWPIYLLAAFVLLVAVLLGALLVVPELAYWGGHHSWAALSGEECAHLLGWAVLPEHWGRLTQGYPVRLRTVNDRALLGFVVAELGAVLAVSGVLAAKWLQDVGAAREGGAPVWQDELPKASRRRVTARRRGDEDDW